MLFTRRFIISCCIEFGPLVAFFIGSQLHGFFLGTKLLVATTPLALTASYVRDRRFAVFPFSVGMFVLLLGGATLLFHDPRWIQLEYTLYNGLFGGTLLIGLTLRKLPMKSLFDSIVSVTDRGWEFLSLRFGIMLVLLALLNEIVRHFHGINWWVYFRLFSSLFSFIFCMSQLYLLRRERLPDASPWGLKM